MGQVGLSLLWCSAFRALVSSPTFPLVDSWKDGKVEEDTSKHQRTNPPFQPPTNRAEIMCGWSAVGFLNLELQE